MQYMPRCRDLSWRVVEVGVESHNGSLAHHQARDVHAVATHLIKCFDNVKSLKFDSHESGNTACAMVSSEGEEIDFLKTFKVRGAVEEWMRKVEQAMQAALQSYLEKALVDYEAESRLEWVQRHPAQRVNMLFDHPSPVEQLSSLLEEEMAQLRAAAEFVAGELSGLERKKLVALITADVHHRDISQLMLSAKVNDVGSFTWQMQLQYCVEQDEPSESSTHIPLLCVVKQAHATVPYQYEYEGATSRLVVTPLTDRCWMTITAALHLHLGSAPTGPAGTGKTETVKDLAKGLATQCVV
ncbi:MAG: hypothetical protein SGPRY_004507, partial [Prymnesium sp.]